MPESLLALITYDDFLLLSLTDRWTDKTASESTTLHSVER